LGPHRIRVNAVLPGYIQTPLFLSDAERVTGGHPERFIAELERKIRLRRLGEPEDVAGLCAFLASDDSSYVSGACLAVDGAVSVQL
jgi:3-oxoacyl-[acyl-carrier protein] reductase